MKILILSTFDKSGGAAIVSTRLKRSLLKFGHEVKMGVLFKEDDQNFLIAGDSLLNRGYAKALFILERLRVLSVISKRPYLYKFSIGRWGIKIHKLKAFKEADVVHLHWINFSAISIGEIQVLSKMKPVVWTLYDMWAFTGGCHYALGCNNYTSNCYPCYYLKEESKLAYDMQQYKKKILGDSKVHLVTNSNWLKECINQDSILKNLKVSVVGSNVDTDIFIPQEKDALRRKYNLPAARYYILFGSVDNSDERKGLTYLLKALSIISAKLEDYCLLTFGKSVEGVDCTSFGQISSEEKLSEIYNLADVFILPSIQDNLPNTVLEALSCQLPVVAFDCGGVNDMILHKVNGFLASNRNADDLAEGILYFLDEQKRQDAGGNARELVKKNFSDINTVEGHIQVYESVIKQFEKI